MTQLFGESEKVTRLVRFERDQILVVGKAECVRQMDLYIREPLSDHEILFDHGIPLVDGHFEPIFMLRTWIEKMILRRAGRNPLAVFARSIDEHHSLRDRKIVVNRFKMASKVRAIQFRGHVLDAVERIADTPEHDVRLGVEADERVAEKQEIVTKRLEDACKFALVDALCFGIQFSPGGIDPQEHEVHELLFDRGRLGNIGAFRHQPQLAVGGFFLKLKYVVSHSLLKVRTRIILPINRSMCKSLLFGRAFTKLAYDDKIVSVNRTLFTILLLIAGALAASAQQRPLLTDDVDITPPGSLQIGVGVDFFQNAKFPLSGINGDLTRVGDIRIRTGFSPNVELQIEGSLQNYVAINSRGTSAIPLNVTGNSTNDFDDFTVSAKVKLRNETRLLPAVGLKFGFQMPNTDQSRGIGTNQINVFTKILLQKKFGDVVDGTPKFNAMGNVGLQIMTAPIERFTQNDVILYGLAGVYRVTDRFNVLGEVNGRVNTRSGTAPLGTESVGQFRIGTQIKASGLRFDTAAAFGLTKFSPRTGVIFGVTYLSPSIFTPAK